MLGCGLGIPAHAGAINWDLSNIGIAGASGFSADALKATEVSHIVFDSPTTFVENGYAKITGIVNNGSVSTPTGLNTAYSLYFQFSITGSLITAQFNSFTFDLYGVDGVSTFGFDGGNNATVTDVGTRILMATNSLVSGSIGGAPGLRLIR